MERRRKARDLLVSGHDFNGLRNNMNWPEDFVNKIIQGDCLEVMKQMPDKCVDLLIADPPYGINVGRPIKREREKVQVGGAKPFGKGRNTRSIAPKSYRGFDDSRIPSKEVFDEMFRISKNQVIFGANYFTEYLKNSSCWFVWDKDNGESYFADCELAWTSFDTAVRKFKWKWNGMLQERMGEAKEERYHPTQKPIPLLAWILRNYSKETDIILDPFLGSGTTGIAASMLNRKFIGIEISPDYCKIAEERIRQVANKLF